MLIVAHIVCLYYRTGQLTCRRLSTRKRQVPN